MTYTTTREPLSQNRSEPAFAVRVGVWASIERHWRMFVLVALVPLAAALAYGIVRKPTYTAETRLVVGRIDVSPSLLANYTTATQGLADQYSRMVVAEPVVQAVARDTHVSPATVRSNVSATPVDKTPVFRLSATRSSAAEARAVANSAAKQLRLYLARVNRRNPDSDRLLSEYSRDLARVYKLEGTERRRRAAVDQADTAANRARINAAREARQAAQLRANASGTAYQSSQQGRASAQLVQVLSPATSAHSDRSSKLQIYGFIGLVVGLVLATALVTLRANRTVAHRLGRR